VRCRGEIPPKLPCRGEKGGIGVKRSNQREIDTRLSGTTPYIVGDWKIVRGWKLIVGEVLFLAKPHGDRLKGSQFLLLTKEDTENI
jgi:hypothetical protein